MEKRENSKRRRSVRVLFFLILLYNLIPVCLLVSAVSYAMLWGSGWQPKFKIAAYDTYVQFASPIYCDRIGYDSVTSNPKVYFYNIKMDGSVSGWFWVSAKNCNVTITKFFKDNKLEFTVAGSGSGTISLYSPKKPQYVTVDGVESNSWSYDENAKVLTLTLSLSNHKIIVSFSPVTEAFSTFRTLWSSFLILIAFTFSASLLIKVANGELSIMEFIWGFVGVILGTSILFILLDVVEAI